MEAHHDLLHKHLACRVDDSNLFQDVGEGRCNGIAVEHLTGVLVCPGKTMVSDGSPSNVRRLVVQMGCPSPSPPCSVCCQIGKPNSRSKKRIPCQEHRRSSRSQVLSRRLPGVQSASARTVRDLKRVTVTDQCERK